MRIYIKKQKNGSLRSYFTGEYTINGQRHVVALNNWKGNPPSLRGAQGDAVFEQSKAEALAKLKEIVNQLSTPKSQIEFERLQQLSAKHLLKQRYGVDMVSTPIDTLLDRFNALLPQSRSRVYRNHNLLIIQTLTSFLTGKVRFLEDVSLELIQAWMQHVTNMGFANRTYNTYLSATKRLFKELCPYGACNMWLQKQKLLPNNCISRELFTPEEITAIINTASTMSPSVKSMVVIASCTGLRLKDICLLKWSSVDFERNMITLTTHKTGGHVTLGMWTLLRNELLALPRDGIYVLPSIADQYTRNPSHLQTMLKRVLVECGYGGELLKETTNRKKFATLRGWHSFRGSFVVSAIRAGVKMELIKKVLGSTTVDVIYNHYIKVDDNFMQESFTNKAPSYARDVNFSTSSNADKIRSAVNLLKTATSQNWREIINSVVAMLDNLIL